MKVKIFAVPMAARLACAVALLWGASSAQAATLYVDPSLACGTCGGTSWADAYDSLQKALSSAGNGDEIWVAEGVYVPGADPSASFVIPPGVALYGGFRAGGGSFSARDWGAHPTVLSGDVGGDDLNADGNHIAEHWSDIQGDNAHHVVWLSRANEAITDTTRLDGFIVTAGQANGADEPHYSGGGLYCGDGGYSAPCSPTLTNLRFSGNWSYLGGGAVSLDSTYAPVRPSLINVIFSGNGARGPGGAIYSEGASRSSSASPTLINVVFRNNEAQGDGGAMANRGFAGFGGTSSPTLINVTFFGNRSDRSGGAIANSEGNNDSVVSPTLSGVILWGNQSATGDQIFHYNGANTTIDHSLIEGGLDGGVRNWGSGSGITDGGGNLFVDPLFTDPAAGNLSLLPTSPAVDAGNNAALPPGLSEDLAGNDRVSNGVVDMGAYEYPSGTAPTLSVADVAVTEGDSGTVNATFTVSLSFVANDPITVDYSTVGASASAGTDFGAISGTLSIPALTASATVDVPVYGDTTAEGDEQFELVLSNPSEGTLGDPRAVATITGDDQPQLLVSDAQVVEGDSGTSMLSFELTLSKASAQSIRVDYATADGSALAGEDYVSTSGTARFSPGEVGPVSVGVPVNGDPVREGDETLTLQLSNAVNVVLANAGTGTIRNDDAEPTITIDDTSVVEGTVAAPVARFDIHLSHPSAFPVSVDYRTVDGASAPYHDAIAPLDYLPASGSLIFAPGDLHRTVEVTVVGDPLMEYDEVFGLIIENAVNAQSAGPGRATIRNDDDDGDTVPAAEEDAGPNGGDGNGDGVPDALQTTVASFVNPDDGHYITLEASGACTGIDAVGPADPGALPDDPSWVYPFGRIAYALACDSVDATFLFHGADSIATLYLRRRSDGPHGPWINDASVRFGSRTVGGVDVPTASATARDGDGGDIDERAGHIEGIAGLASLTASVPAAGTYGLAGLALLLALIGAAHRQGDGMRRVATPQGHSALRKYNTGD